MNISSAGNLSRVSTSLRTYTLLTQLQRNTLSLFREEQRIGSGRGLLSIADDPIAAEKIARMVKDLEGQDQILSNLRTADGFLAAADSAIADIADLFTEAARIASEQAGNLQTAEERASQAAVIDGIISQLQHVGNRRYQGQFLFGGRSTGMSPITDASGRATFTGDQGERRTVVDYLATLPFNTTTSQIFGTRDRVVGGYQTYDVQLNTNTRVSELGGAAGEGVTLGTIAVSETGPNINFTVDFTGAETVGDLIARFNNAALAAGSGLTLGINPADGATLRITPPGGSGVTVGESGQGTAAFDLGIRKTVGAGVPLDGENLNRKMNLTTLLSDLGASGVSLPSGVTITNGGVTKTVSFAGATTAQDVLNAINSSGAHVRARINDAGNAFEIENLAAGSVLVIGENGGSDADALGIRTLSGQTPVSQLNRGLGIHPVEGNDLRITDSNGVSFEVNFSGVVTVQDVLDAINTASAGAGANITADLSPNGSGIRLTGAAGPNSITVESPNPPLSPVAQELGIAGVGNAVILEGTAVGGFTQTGSFSALYRLRDALLADDSAEITEAGRLLNLEQKRVSGIAGAVGSRARDVQSRVTQLENAVAATEALLTGLRDVDFVEAVTRFQQAQTALAASLQVGSATLNLSLLNYLR